MKIRCKNCLPKEGIEIPDFTQSEKLKLLQLKTESPIHLVKYIVDNYALGHGDAKYVVTHINKVYGHCNHCIFNKLDGEYTNCPKCGALNLNWKII